MIPEDPGLQNRRRIIESLVGQVSINIPNTATLTTTVATGELYLGGGTQGNVFYFGGVRNIDLGFDLGTVITFNQDDASNDGHPLIITTDTSSPNSYIVSSGVVYYLDGTSTQSNYVNTTTFNAATNRYVQWTPSAAGTYYYACYVHGIGMGGKITIS
jgi:plastocyanin